MATRSLRQQSILDDLQFGNRKFYKDCTNAGKIFGCDLSFSNYIVVPSVVFVLRCVTIRPGITVLTLNDDGKDMLVAFLGAFLEDPIFIRNEAPAQMTILTAVP